MGWQFRTARRCARINRSYQSVSWCVAFVLAGAAAIARATDESQSTVYAASSSALIQPGTKVGTFELGAPTIDRFVLHGTLPIPPRIYPMPDGSSPFQIRDPEGNVFPAQTEIVTRYAAEGMGADVVEIVALVPKPERAGAGDRIQYDILYDPHTEDAFEGSPDVEDLLETAGAITMQSRDVFGNVYKADLTAAWRDHEPSLRILRRGSQAVQFATHQSLAPDRNIQGDQGTLPHLMGIHAYVTQWRHEPVWTCTARRPSCAVSSSRWA